ncbi:putative receptor-like protein kinase [Hibiscus syriacus]|uniref:non-specific serine/threonine protein kinase n=1 Tax=Hibiscus syriacus TaxID=106335 RepID=A0A6A3A203_HIBSY|nr:LEAF RUST 10 DISEASE-RESISTANCE LOCUS RECEPTOR-LIKE PROTEIN KINASE-like 1.2 [Hibiscus syriacus]KAE8698208.1 putative receptor-like protein kinase [Hibiscus syriacus]
MHHLSTFLSISLLFFAQLPISYAQNATGMQCYESFRCGNMSRFVFPFWKEGSPGICHNEGFELTKCDEEDDEPVIRIGADEFRLISVDQPGYRMTIARDDLWEGICPSPRIHNITLGYPFSFPPTNRNLTFFYDCDESVVPSDGVRFPCTQGSNSFYADLVDRGSYERFSRSCHGGVIQVQINRTNFQQLNREGPEILGSGRWRLGFDVEYNFPEIFCGKCNSHKGLCDNVSSPRYPVCKKPGKGFSLQTKLLIGFGAAAGGILITCVIFCFWLRHRRGKGIFKSYFLTSKSSLDHSSVVDSEKGDSFACVHVFTYKELEEATNNFDSDRELGDGGFGTVYYGKLRDGRAVAVKRLYENNYKRVEQFMNEVGILTRLRHQNLVSLYGSTSRHSRELLLVYEYIPNGTVADHLHGDLAKPGALSWNIRLEIAIETADALMYLHASETIHRDVKTNNILLDKDFHVKVADFGLSRLFPSDVTHVSTAPQGTPGYVDPEYHQCYQLTSKSDVFSFGVVLIELISSKPAVDITRHRHEINLWNMAINKIQNGALHDLVDPSLGFETNNKVRNAIAGVAEVAFWCLQDEKDMRPTMAQVVEALMGIKNEDYKKGKAVEMDMFTAEEEGGLLKSGPMPRSPDSVMIKWVSNGSSTTNTTPSF